MFDIDRIIKTLSSEHNIRINRDDPVIDVLYFNQAILEDYVKGIHSQISQSITEIAVSDERVSRKLSKLLSDGHARQNSTLEKILLRHIDDINAILARAFTRPETKVSPNGILWLIIAFLLGLILGGAAMHYFSR